MENSFRQKVYYSDTDAYGVVWHGSYLRWFEMGRINLCEQVGYSLTKLYDADITLPVVEINLKYKSPAKLEDELLIVTSLKEISRLSMTFEQKIINAKTEKLNVEAIVKVVAVHNDGNLYRTLPEQMIEFAQKVKD
ncbi:acyl-CoA thioesterase [bacterium]|nr:acyl-CoA thioesterase [bacterium]